MKRFIFFTIFSILLVGCQPSPFKSTKGHPAINDINASLQEGIDADQKAAQKGHPAISSELSASLMPQMSLDHSALKNTSEQRFNISVKDVPAQSFFMSLVQGTSQNMIVDPEVKGAISLDLKNVTIDDVLNAVHDIYGYQYERTSYSYQVFARSLETRLFTVNYIDVLRSGVSSMSVTNSDLYQSTTGTTGASGSTTTSQVQNPLNSQVETKTVADFWKSLQETLTAFVGTADGRQVIINPKSGTIIVKAYPDELRRVAGYLDAIQSTMNRQVIIEAKFLDVTLNHEYQTGIDWSLLGNRFSQTMSNVITPITTTTTNAAGISTSTTVNAPTPNALVLDPSGGAASVIRLLSTQGNVQVLQSPRITTMNNQKAIFKVGTDAYYITNVSGSTTSNGGAGAGNVSSQTVTTSPFFSGVVLDVTPQIDANNDIILHIHPMISDVTNENTIYQINGQTQSIPLAKSDIRESDTLVRAKSGQIVVIGGLMTTDTEEEYSGAPYLGKIPFVGSLFSGQHQKAEKRELVILLRPVVVGSNVWTNQLKNESKNFAKMNKGFHLGDAPEIFGNQAEFEYRKQVQEKYSK